MNFNQIKVYGIMVLAAALFLVPKTGFAQYTSYQDCLDKNDNDPSLCVDYQNSVNATANTNSNPDQFTCEEDTNNSPKCADATYATCIVGGGTDASCSAAQSANANPDQFTCEEDTNNSPKCSNPTYATCIVQGGTDTSCSVAQDNSGTGSGQTLPPGHIPVGGTNGTGQNGTGGTSGTNNTNTGSNAASNNNGSLAGAAQTNNGTANNSNTSNSKTFTLSNPLTGVNSVSDIVFTFMKILSYLAVIFGVIMLMWVGLQFVLAQGKPEEIKKRSNELLWIVVGVGIILGARILITVVINTLSASGAVNSSIIQNASNAVKNL